MNPSCSISSGLRSRWLFLGLLFFVCVRSGFPAAFPPDQPAESLAQERSALVQRQQELAAQKEAVKKRTSELAERTVSPNTVDEARLAVDSARVQLEAARLDRLAAVRQLKELDADISGLEERLSALVAGSGPLPEGRNRESAIAQARQELAKKKQQRSAQEQRVSNLQQAEELSRGELTLAQDWWRAVRERLQEQQQAARQEVLADLERRVQREQARLQEQVANLRGKLRTLPETPENAGARHLLETQITSLEESGYLLQMRLEIERARHTLAGLEETLSPSARLSQSALHDAMGELGTLVDTLSSVQGLAQRKVQLIRQQLEVLERRQTLGEAPQEQVEKERELLTDLVNRFENELAALEPVLALARQRYGTVQELYRKTVQRGLSVRHRLFGKPNIWPEIGSQLWNLPGDIFRAVADSATALWRALSHAVPRTIVSLTIALAVWWWIWRRFVGGRTLPGRFPSPETFAGKVRVVAFRLLRENRRAVFITVALLGGAFILRIPAADLTLLSVLFGSWLIARALHSGIRRILVGEYLPPSERQYGIYRLAVRTTWAGAVFAVVLSLGHLGVYPLMLRNFLDRVFMLFLFLPAFLGFRIRPAVIDAVARTSPPRYWLQVVRLIALLIPVSLLVAAALGTAGFLNLAWTVAAHLGWFLAVLSGWLVLRGLLRDAAALSKDYANRASPHGLDWAQGVIEPLHQILRFVLLIGAIWLLVRILGWGPESVFGEAVRGMLSKPLGRIGNVTIDIQHVLVTIFVAVFSIWLGRQVRELTYRWLYSGIIDIGVRHSLAVFTQYAVVIAGLLIALDIFGLDLTSLAIFAGALGVGIGFGLQAIANNFISGIILLAERPLRTGDWVTIGTNEGEVSRIGMRSVTVTTWDNQEVIIPNSDIISSAFTNWTHQDNLVRTVIRLRISYEDDPRTVRALLENVVASETAVLSQPSPRVWLNEMGESSFEFWVQYFTDVRKHLRLETRSSVLLAIWDRLQAEGITIPFPQQAVHIADLSRSSEQIPPPPEE